MKRLARALRALADYFDTPTPPGRTRRSPHPPALADPVELSATPAAVGQKHEGAGGGHLYHDGTPGRWGGPYV